MEYATQTRTKSWRANMSGICGRCGTGHVAMNTTTTHSSYYVDCPCSDGAEVLLREFERLSNPN